jgi:uncharacterized protein (TIGR02449 family)
MDTQSTALQGKIDKLESTVQQLLVHCETVQSSNKELMLERSELLNKNEKVRTQIEGMVERLKSAESS